MSLATYMSTLASSLGESSREAELGEAFAAFDLDDAGVIDLGELRGALAGDAGLSEEEVDAVLNEFSGKRGLARGGGKRGEVFRYREFVAALGGGGGNGGGEVTEEVEVGG